jgi:hypothetical protein
MVMKAVVIYYYAIFIRNFNISYELWQDIATGGKKEDSRSVQMSYIRFKSTIII